MKFRDILEITPPTSGTATPPASGITTPSGSTTMSPGQQVSADPAAQSKMMAQQALDRQKQKKEIQDQIKLKQQELTDLQKRLAELS
jgi:hypothetical protein